MGVPANTAYVQGQTQVNADGLNTFVQTCTTAVQLRGFVGLANMQIFLDGIASVGDGAGGVFYWNPTSNAPDDNFNVIVPTGVASGAWLRLPFGGVGSGVTDFPSVAAVQNGAITGTINFIRTASYDGSSELSGAHWARVAAQPPHSMFIKAGDGSFWEINESQMDPRMIGAKADVVFQRQCTIANGSNQVTISDGTYSFSAADLNKTFTIWQYPWITGFGVNYVVGIITGIISASVAQLSVTNTGVTLTNCWGYFGTDDTVAIAAAISASGYSTAYFDVTDPQTAGGREVVFRAAGPSALSASTYPDVSKSRYGILTPIYALDYTKIRCEENAQIDALGNFTGTAMIMQEQSGGAPKYNAKLRIDNLKLNANGFAGGGVFWQKTIESMVSGNTRIFNAQNYGMRMGDVSNGYVCDGWSIDGRFHAESVTQTGAFGGPAGWVNTFSGTVFAPTSGTGLWLDQAPDGCCTANVECVNYRTGFYHNSGTDVDFSGQIHSFTNSSGGYMSAAAILNAGDCHYFTITADTPWNANGSPYYGVVITNWSRVDVVRADLNIADAPATQDKMGIAVYFTSSAYNSSQNMKPAVGTVYYQSTAPNTAKWATVVDNSTFTTTDVLVDKIVDTNQGLSAYNTGLVTRDTALRRLTGTGVLSSGLVGSTNLWTPPALGQFIPFWLDATIFKSFDLDANNGVNFWYSRSGIGKGLQSFSGLASGTTATFRPTYNSTGLSGGGYTFLQTATVDFNGTSTLLMLDDIVGSVSDIRVFDVLIPRAASQTGTLLYLNNAGGCKNTFINMTAGGTAILAQPAVGGSSAAVTTVAGTPYLLTTIYSSTGIDGGGAGLTLRLNGGTNATVGSLGGQQIVSQCAMGAQANASWANVSFSERIVIVGAMTLAQEQLVEGYLAWKYWQAVSAHSPILPNTHPYYNAAPLNAS